MFNSVRWILQTTHAPVNAGEWPAAVPQALNSAVGLLPGAAIPQGVAALSFGRFVRPPGRRAPRQFLQHFV